MQGVTRERAGSGTAGDADAAGRGLPAWVAPRMRAERRDAYGLLWVGLGGVALFALALQIPASGTSPWLFVVFGAVVAGVLALGVHHAVRNRRYRDVVLALDTVPVALGGRLRGMLETEVPPDRVPPGGFLVTFGCYRRHERQDSHGRREIVFDPLWEDEKWMRPRPCGDGSRVAIPVAFDVPAGLPQASGDPGAGRMRKMWGQPERIAWRVHARANVSGSRFRTVVEVPVLAVDHVEDVDGAPPEPVYEEAEVRDRYDEPESPGIGMERLPGGGVRFSFAPARHRGHAVGMTLAAAAALGIVAGAGPHPALAVVLLLVAAAAGYGAWRYWTFASTVTVRDGSVEVWHGAAGRRSTTVLPCEAVEAVRVGPRSDGRFDVRLVPRGGGEHVRAARGIGEREEAGWIAGRIEEAAARQSGSTA